MISPNHWAVRGVRGLLRLPVRLARRVRPQAASTPPWERSVLDDIAASRPWNLRVKLARRIALNRLSSLHDGVTVVVVNWNTRDVTADVIRRVQDLSPPTTEIVVVDNGSTDGSRELFAGWPGIRTMLLRSNAGHGVALDLAVSASRTEVTVTLDSDALPLTSDWLDPAVRPIREQGAVLAGLRSSRGFVHPVYSAVRTAEFLRRGLSFQAFIPAGIDNASARWGENAWDTSELLVQRMAGGEVAFVERTDNPAPGLPGMTAGGVVYHHGGVSRASSGQVEPEALDLWRAACTALREAQPGQAAR